jgi:hypothetical protein
MTKQGVWQTACAHIFSMPEPLRRRNMAMTDAQTQRPTSESLADDPRIKRPDVPDADPSSPDARPAQDGRSRGLPRAGTLGAAIAIVGIAIIIIMMLAR